MAIKKEALEIIKKADSAGYELIRGSTKEERAKSFMDIMERQFAELKNQEETLKNEQRINFKSSEVAYL